MLASVFTQPINNNNKEMLFIRKLKPSLNVQAESITCLFPFLFCLFIMIMIIIIIIIIIIVIIINLFY